MTPITPYQENVIERLTARIATSPMQQWLGMSVAKEEDTLTYKLSFAEDHIGNPIIRALHGGVISSFLESCAWLDLYGRVEDGTGLRTTSVHTSYFRSSTATDMFAEVSVKRLGRRFAFAEITGWQGEPDNVVARTATGIRVMRVAETA